MKKVVFKSLKYKNFLSSGDSPTKIDFTRNGVTVIVGNSGTGKSTITDALCLAACGRPLRKIPKNKLVNRKNNKSLEVVLEFDVNNVPYLVKRTIKPESFEIYKDGKLLPQDASSRDYQSQLDMILGMNFQMFLQTVVISKTKYTPFIQLDAAARRVYVESVLNLNVFGDMQKLHARNQTELKSSLVASQGICKEKRTQAENAERNYHRICELINNAVQQKSDAINADIAASKRELETQVAQLRALESSVVVFDDNPVQLARNIENQLSTLKGRSAETQRQIEQLKGDSKCSACGQTVKRENIEEHTAELNKRLDDIAAFVANKTKELNALLPLIEKYNANEEVMTQIAHQKSMCNRTASELKGLKLKLESANKTVDFTARDEAFNEYNTAKKSAEESQNAHFKLLEQKDYYDIISDTLKDGGIKSTVVEKYIPLINHVINQNLSKFGFFINFELDNTFNETIKLNGIHQLEYFGFSEGEKLRIDMSILMAWREITQLYTNMSCNLLMFDEMADASLDYEGSNVLSSLLASLEGSNVFVITHTPEKLENIARSTIKFEKVNGYSHIV